MAFRGKVGKVRGCVCLCGMEMCNTVLVSGFCRDTRTRFGIQAIHAARSAILQKDRRVNICYISF